MKLLIACSDGKIPSKPKPFSLTFDDEYARRFIWHLKNVSSLCTGCGKACVNCRGAYNLNFSSKISKVIKVPASLPYYVDTPEKFFPDAVEASDIIVGINVHEELLLYLPYFALKAKAKALIFPIEDPSWASEWTRREVNKLCKELGLECSFPKPFCSLKESKNHPVINRFMEEFKIGRPLVDIKVEKGKVKEVKVIRSAPCGNTYFVAHNLEGKRIGKNFEQLVAKYWHSYPCIASMKMDFELGDTILHEGGYIHLKVFREALNAALGQTKVAASR